MAGKPKPMSQIKQLLRLHKQGKGKKFIASALGISRNTVKSYLRKAEGTGMDIESLLKLDDPVLEKKFHAGNPAYKEERYDTLKEKLDYYVSELERTGVTRGLLWQEYREVYPSGYSRSQFYHHLQQHKKAAKPSMILEHKAGEKLFVDFAGKLLSYVDTATGEIVKCYVFVACLPYSDYSFAMAVKSQTTEDFLYALRCCLEDIGGAPEVLVPDNLKAAVIKADKYEPGINRALEDFANHYKFTVIPARAYKPRDKALVENQVKIIYSRVYARLRDMQFHSITDLNKAIKEKVKLHNQTRMQRKPWSREEKFIADEKHLLKPLPKEQFELKYYTSLKVQMNNHVFLGTDKHYYSVPYQHIGKKAKVVYTHSMVYIYIDGNQVAVHRRSRGNGFYTTVKEHLCSAHQKYKDRSPEYYIKKAHLQNSDLGTYIEALFKQDSHPEQLYKSCDGLLSIERKTRDKQRFRKACRIALDNGIFGYRRFIRVLENNANFVDEEPVDTTVKASENNIEVNTNEDARDNLEQKGSLPPHKNIRGKDHYKTLINSYN